MHSIYIFFLKIRGNKGETTDLYDRILMNEVIHEGFLNENYYITNGSYSDAAYEFFNKTCLHHCNLTDGYKCNKSKTSIYL